MSKNENLGSAKRTKNDEFYTQLSDIEKELKHYKPQLKGAVVYCNCDDPSQSNFWRYFENNFDILGLKALIATCYNPVGSACRMEIHRDPVSGDRLPAERMQLHGNGDFRSSECVEVLQRADVVVTNPPFSLFREYIAQLMQYGKKFIVVGNMNAITYKEIFPLLKRNKLWLGYTNPKRFMQPDGTLKAFGNILWYTNVDIDKRHEPLVLTEEYQSNPARYPKYCNYDGIECARVKDIPADYFGEIGVPITFLGKHCPVQFEIVGISRELGRPMSEIVKAGEEHAYEHGGIRFYLRTDREEQDFLYKRLYDRIVIRRVDSANACEVAA